MLNTVSSGEHDPSKVKCHTSPANLVALFNDLAMAQTAASERSFRTTRRHGVLQVVDKPGADRNFVEASSSFMTAYCFLAGHRLSLFHSQKTANRALRVAKSIYSEVSKEYLIMNANGTLSLNGTSSVASLSGEVNYEVSFTKT